MTKMTTQRLYSCARSTFLTLTTICVLFGRTEGFALNITAPTDGIVTKENNAEEISNTLQPFPDVVADTEKDLRFRAMLCNNTPRSLLPFYRFHLTTRTCYLTGSQGPCGSNMIFVKESFTRAIGKCICNPIIGQHRPLVHHRESNQCYFLYTQGYCVTDEWLVPISGENINRDSNSYWAICRNNQCKKSVQYVSEKPISTENPKSIEFSNSTENPNSNSTDVQNSTENPNTVSTENFILPENPGKELELEFVIYNGNCVQLGTLTDLCPGNETVSFRDGILICNVARVDVEIATESEKMPDLPIMVLKIREPENAIPSIISRALPLPHNENEIVASEFRRRRRRRAIISQLFPRSANYPGRGNFRNLIIESLAGEDFPYGVQWSWNPRKRRLSE